MISRIYGMLMLVYVFQFTAARAQTGSCSEAVDGFASVSGEGFTTTTGGAGGTVTTVSNLADLTTWAAGREKNTAAGILYISGKIESPASMILTIKNGANVSIIGKNGGELKNIGLNIRDYNNVIVQNLKIHEVLYPNDALTLDNVNHGWVTHCEMFSTIGPGIGYDTYDGLLDVKNGSRYITLSWNRLHDHMKVMLIGHTDNTGSQTIDEAIRVSLHHNFFYNTDGRNPSLRWGAVHSYNNYFRSISDYGLASRRFSHVKIENNVYKNVKQPITTDNFIVVTGDDGSVCESGCQFIDCGANSITQTNCAWWTATTLPYKYTLTPTASVASLVEANAGVCGEAHLALPEITITSPANNSVFATSTSIPLTSSVSIAGGTIAKVVYFTKKEDKYTILGTVTAAPFSFTWTSPALGPYNVYAYAYDAAGNFIISNCVQVTVSASAVPTLTSTSSNNSQTVTAGTAIQNIVLTWGGSATDAAASNLPAGLTATKNAAAKTITISGTPKVTGTYTVSTSGGTPAATATGTITVDPANAASLTITANTAQTVGAGTAIQTIVFTWGGSSTDVTYTALPAGLAASKDAAAKTLSISGIPNSAGTFTVTTTGGIGSKSIDASIAIGSSTVLARWYPFQETPMSLTFVSLTDASVNTAYDASAYSAAGCTNGAAVLLKATGTITLKLNSLSALKLRFGASGSRSFKVSFGATGTETVWTSAVYPSGGYEIDLIALNAAIASAQATVVNITNLGTGNLNITDLYVEGTLAVSTKTQSIALAQGWNLISINVRPSDSTIATLFKGLDVAEIKDMKSYWQKDQPPFLNLLQTITPGNGYLINMNAKGTLEVTGVPIVESHGRASLQTNGWQLIGCPYQTATPAAGVWGSNFSAAKNFEGFWIPNATGNTIENLEPGKAYFIKK